MSYNGYLLCKTDNLLSIVNGIDGDDPILISPAAWAATYGVMKHPHAHTVSPGERLVPVRVYANGDLEIFECCPPGVASSFDKPVQRMAAREVYAENATDFPYPAAAFGAGEYDMELEGRIIDWQEFDENFDLDGDRLTIGVNFVRTMFPEQFGRLPAEITGTQFRITGTDFKLTLNVRIDDPDLFLMMACHGGRNSGRDADYVPESMGDAIFEA